MARKAKTVRTRTDNRPSRHGADAWGEDAYRHAIGTYQPSDPEIGEPATDVRDYARNTWSEGRGVAGEADRPVAARRRDDDEIRDDVEAWLADNDQIALSRVRVSVEHGRVHLRGQIGSRVARRWACESAIRVQGVKAVEDDLEVLPDAEDGG